MKNITEILKSIGIEIPEDKAEAFNTEFLKNYKTVAELNSLQNKYTSLEGTVTELNEKISAREKDVEDLNNKLKEAGQSKDKLTSLQTELDNLNKTYADEKAEFEKKLASQQYEFLVKEKVSGLKFSSNSAKKAFTAEVLNQGLQVKDGSLLGFDDFVKKYQEDDASAFVTDSDGSDKDKGDDNPPPNFTSKNNGKGTGEDKKPADPPYIF